MTGFDVYKIYLALKTHFGSESYDYWKYGGKISAKLSTYERRRDVNIFRYIAKKYTKKEVFELLVANFSNGGSVWIGDLSDESVFNTYKKWKSKLESISYVFEEDINNVMNFITERGIKFNSLFKVDNGEHPLLFRFLQQGMIEIESFIILNMILKFYDQFDKDISEEYIWPTKHLLCVKYTPFLSINVVKMKSIVVDRMRHYDIQN